MVVITVLGPVAAVVSNGIITTAKSMRRAGKPVLSVKVPDYAVELKSMVYVSN